MKRPLGASSIIALASFFLVAGCDSVHVPNLLGPDEVPDEVKAQPRAVQTYVLPAENEKWPRLGDVPFKPKDFTPKAVSEQEIRELEQARSEAEAARLGALQKAPPQPDAAVRDEIGGAFPIRAPEFLNQ